MGLIVIYVEENCANISVMGRCSESAKSHGKEPAKDSHEDYKYCKSRQGPHSTYYDDGYESLSLPDHGQSEMIYSESY